MITIAREKKLLKVMDHKGVLVVAFYGQDVASLELVERHRVELTGEDIEFFAGMLINPEVLDKTGKVDLKEPDYPYIIRVRWDNHNRILSFLPWEEGGAVEKIRLSPLDALKIGKLAERTCLINHLIERLKFEG